MIRVMIVEDHQLVRTGIRQIIQDTENIQVVGEASNGMEAINLLRNLNPQVAILDVNLPDFSGLEVTTKMLSLNPGLKILVVTAITNDLIAFDLLEAGAKGYLTKDAAKDELVRAIKAVNAGQHVISPKIANHLALSKISLKTNTFFNILASREMEIMKMVINGMEAKEIAAKLQINYKTVHTYRSRIFEKLNIKNDVELTLLALRHKIISMDENSNIHETTALINPEKTSHKD